MRFSCKILCLGLTLGIAHQAFAQYFSFVYHGIGSNGTPSPNTVYIQIMCSNRIVKQGNLWVNNAIVFRSDEVGCHTGETLWIGVAKTRDKLSTKSYKICPSVPVLPNYKRMPTTEYEIVNNYSTLPSYACFKADSDWFLFTKISKESIPKAIF